MLVVFTWSALVCNSIEMIFKNCLNGWQPQWIFPSQRDGHLIHNIIFHLCRLARNIKTFPFNNDSCSSDSSALYDQPMVFQGSILTLDEIGGGRKRKSKKRFGFRKNFLGTKGTTSFSLLVSENCSITGRDRIMIRKKIFWISDGSF